MHTFIRDMAPKDNIFCLQLFYQSLFTKVLFFYFLYWKQMLIQITNGSIFTDGKIEGKKIFIGCSQGFIPFINMVGSIVFTNFRFCLCNSCKREVLKLPFRVITDLSWILEFYTGCTLYNIITGNQLAIYNSSRVITYIADRGTG